MTHEFDDPQIESMLGRLSGAYPDDNVAFAAVRGRVRQVKRRRAFVASTAACVALFGLATFAAQGGGRNDQLSPADTFSDSTAATSTDVTVETSMSTVDGGSEGADTSVAETTIPVISLTIPDPSTSNNSGSGSGNSGSSSSSSTSTPLADGSHTYVSDGGSVIISSTDGVLTLVSTDPADEFEERVDQRKVEAHRVRVEFTDGDITWRIEVRTDNGELREEITQHG